VLKLAFPGADISAAVVDRRFQEHWERECAARALLRDSLPSSWRDDPRPKMSEVREVYIEAMLQMRRSPVRPVAIADDDR